MRNGLTGNNSAKFSDRSRVPDQLLNTQKRVPLIRAMSAPTRGQNNPPRINLNNTNNNRKVVPPRRTTRKIAPGERPDLPSSVRQAAFTSVQIKDEEDESFSNEVRIGNSNGGDSEKEKPNRKSSAKAKRPPITYTCDHQIVTLVSRVE